jgi:hypothetical protein
MRPSKYFVALPRKGAIPTSENPIKWKSNFAEKAFYEVG